MNNKKSIFFKITLFFSLVFIIINSLLYIQVNLDYKSYKTLLFKKYYSIVKIVEDDLEKGLNEKFINEKISAFDMYLTNINLNKLSTKKVEKIDFDEKNSLKVYKVEKKIYIYFKPNSKIVLIDNSIQNNNRWFWLFVLFIIDIILIWFYYFLYKRLKPLISLKKEINKFSEGSLDIDTSTEGEDEISQVSNEFNNAIGKIRELNNSRKLFMRNILHELKTPITKGKLISDTLEEGKKKQILQRAFLRLEYLLEEFVQLEELTSGQIELDKKEYRVIDVLDQALDILLIDKSQVEIYSNLTMIKVDFELFAISLKNLIDNAMKYNTTGKPEIVINKDSLIIKNKGKPFKNTFEEYLKPFNRDYESIDKGLGLGLYITNSIIKRHDYNLYYYYNHNYHIFKIQF